MERRTTMSRQLDLSRRAMLGGTAALAGGLAFGDLARAQTKSGQLTVGVAGHLLTLDPGDANDTLSQSAARLMLEGLLTFDHNMQVVPLLAESFEANDKATEFTFHLRQGITFHDGTPFDAEAVKINFERVANPANHLKRLSLLSMLERVDVLDAHTARCVLKYPFGAFIPTIAHPALQLLSPAAIKTYGKQVGRHPVGTGPFAFASWQPDTLKVVKHAGYWQKGLPHLDALTIRSDPEDGARIAMLRAGEAQMITPIPPQQAQLIQHDPKLALINDPSIVVRYIAMNVNKKPYNDPRVRQALNHAVNKELFAKVVYNGFADPLLSAEPPHITFYQQQAAYDYNPEKAKQLLAAAGYAHGFEATMWGFNNTVAITGMQFLQQQLAMVGVKLKVEPLEGGVMAARIWTVKHPSESHLEMYFGGWSSSTGDADWALRPLFATASFPPVLYNVGYYSNKAVDAALKAGLETADPAKRGAAYAKAQKLIWDDAAWVFLGVERILDARDKNLQDAYRLPDGGLMLDAARYA
ncbi:MAG: glutathione ABC transporter substrate-binding protein [Rhodospirillales bacterium]|nr:glutathione ABC transporter substrate-binding protein [Rhodospirillales bacterium]